MDWCFGFRLRYEAGGRPISYNNNCDSTQRLSGNSYGEIQQGTKLDDPLTVTKNQVSVPFSHLLRENDSVHMRERRQRSCNTKTHVLGQILKGLQLSTLKRH